MQQLYFVRKRFQPEVDGKRWLEYLLLFPPTDLSVSVSFLPPLLPLPAYLPSFASNLGMLFSICHLRLKCIKCLLLPCGDVTLKCWVFRGHFPCLQHFPRATAFDWCIMWHVTHVCCRPHGRSTFSTLRSPFSPGRLETWDACWRGRPPASRAGTFRQELLGSLVVCCLSHWLLVPGPMYVSVAPCPPLLGPRPWVTLLWSRQEW